MPFLEQGELDRVAKQAVKVSKELIALVEQGYDIVTLTASCGLMLKFEWPLILPDNEDVKKLSKATYDIDEYVIDISKRHGLPDGLKSLPEGISIHMACHARAQNMGSKAAELLRLIPDTPIDVIERCAGHGGTFGVLKETHPVAMKVGKPVMRQLVNQARGHVVSDCPLAGKHIVQGARESGRAGRQDIACASGRASDRSLRPCLWADMRLAMPAKDHRIHETDIVAPEIYARERSERRRALIPIKRIRRIEVGPYATFYFENFDTMLAQVHEMLHTEKGGKEQIAGELEVYNPLIPQGSELIATLMIEIDEPGRRAATLLKLAGIEDSVYMAVGASRISATPTDYEDRTTPEGKPHRSIGCGFVSRPIRSRCSRIRTKPSSSA